MSPCHRRASDAAWYRDTSATGSWKYTVIPERPDWIVFAMTTVCERAHDMGLVWDPSPVRGRINHVAYWSTPARSFRAADVLLNQDVAIEFGPGKHGMGEQDYLYFREPGGVRIGSTRAATELRAGLRDSGFEPQQGSNVFYKNGSLPHSMFESFPPCRLHASGAGGGEGRRDSSPDARPRRRRWHRRPVGRDRASSARGGRRHRRDQPRWTSTASGSFSRGTRSARSTRSGWPSRRSRRATR